jgi:hypothetical protein
VCHECAAGAATLPELLARAVGAGHRACAERVFGIRGGAAPEEWGGPVVRRAAVLLGLVNAIVTPDQVMPRALETAKKLAERAPTAVKLSKALMKDPAVVKERMKQEGAHFVAQLASPEVAEAIGAFFEKRKPDFSQF